jgi:PAS domain-containing protein
MPRDFFRGFVRYAMAPLSVAAATLIRLALDPLLGDSFPFLAFFLAILFTARYGGLGPSFLTLILAWLSFDQLFLQPPNPLPFFRSKYQLLFGFFVVGLTLILLCEFTKAAQKLAKESASNAREALESLRANRERLRNTLASIGDAVIAADANGCVESLNPAAEKLTGWRADEAVCLPLREVFRAADRTSGITADGLIAEV